MARATYRLGFAGLESHQFASYISYGLAYPEACVRHISETFHASRVYMLASNPLSRNTDAVNRLVHNLN